MPILSLPLSRAVVSYLGKNMGEVLANRLGLSLPSKKLVRLSDCLDMTIVVDWEVNTLHKKVKKYCL